MWGTMWVTLSLPLSCRPDKNADIVSTLEDLNRWVNDERDKQHKLDASRLDKLVSRLWHRW